MILPAHSRLTQITVKKHFFDFLKVYNELGKVKKFWTSLLFIPGETVFGKRVQAHCAPRTNRVK